MLVRFAPATQETAWVYNGADLRGAPVLWAWQMNADDDCALIAHYPGRRVWDLEITRPG